MLSSIIVTSNPTVSDSETDNISNVTMEEIYPRASFLGRRKEKKQLEQQHQQQQDPPLPQPTLNSLHLQEMLTDKRFDQQLYKPSTRDFVETFQPFALPQGKDIRKEGWLAMMNRTAGGGGLDMTTKIIVPSQTANLVQLETFISDTIRTKFYGGDEGFMFHLYRPCFQYAYKHAKFLKRKRKKLEQSAIAAKKNKNKNGGGRIGLVGRRTSTGSAKAGSQDQNQNQSDGDHIGFSDFRMFAVYLCIYAHMLDAFINNNSNNHINDDDDGDDQDVRICLDQFLERYDSFHNPAYGWKIFENVDSKGMAVVLFDDIDADDTGSISFSQWVKRIKQEEVKHRTELGALLSGRLAFDQRAPLGELQLQHPHPPKSMVSSRNMSSRSLSTYNTNLPPSARAPKEISVVYPPRQSQQGRFSVDGDYLPSTRPSSMSGPRPLHSRNSNKKRKPTKSNTRGKRSTSSTVDGSTLVTMSISINASPLSPNKFRVVMPVKIAGVYKPPKDAPQDLKDFFRSFQPYAEKLATSRSLRKNGFAAHGDGSGVWTLVDVESFVYNTLEEDASDVGWLFMKYKPSFFAAFSNAVELNKIAWEQEVTHENGNVNVIDGAGDDRISFREFRMLNAFLCIYASMLEAFISVRGREAYSSGSMYDDDTLSLSKSEWIDGRGNIEEADFVALKNVSDIHTARTIFKKMDIHELNKVTFMEFCKFVKEAEVHSKTALGRLLAGSLPNA